MRVAPLLVPLTLAAACGGGGGNADAPIRIDGNLSTDAATCTVEPQVTEAPNEAAGNTAALRVQGGSPLQELIEWQFVVPGTGARADYFVFDVPFAPDGTPGYTMNIPTELLNTPLDLVDACKSTVDYCMFLLSDLDEVSGEEAQFFWPNTGTLTITAAGDVGAPFTVAMTESRFDEYDPETSMQVDVDLDGISECHTTVSAFPAATMTIQLPSAVAPGAKRDSSRRAN
jgi:hypothetical protein